MSIFTKIKAAIFSKPVIAAAATALTQAVAEAAKRSNPIGAAAYAAATALEDSALSGGEKKTQVIAAIVPVIIAEATKGGTAIVNDVEQFAGMVVEEVVAQFKQTSLLSIATAILKAIGLK